MVGGNPMANSSLQIAGMAVGFVGWIGSIAVTALPQWRVTAFLPNSANIVVGQVFWEGIWMQCVSQATGQQQCKVYDSLLALTPDMQAARGLMCSGVALGILAILIATLGMQCTHCVENERAKAYIAVSGGFLFIIAALIVLIPVCWTANAIIRDFYNPSVPEALKRELGGALYLGWASAMCLAAGGALLTCSCLRSDAGGYKPPINRRLLPLFSGFIANNNSDNVGGGGGHGGGGRASAANNNNAPGRSYSLKEFV
ncbi:claudin-4-like [Petromyzon marinus]|uniref:Claudin-9-like n=1 Tax=Petromyzon marinus TaxID=7757 RepID=A0AAJ7U2P0_PETMA|nr:claudin-9-like [Petromyzon marinus]XP_032828598.1 claudin-9-like [Petromyzon marinus]XP_032828599.1 claudin-9-like [Petromyzon marinus]